MQMCMTMSLTMEQLKETDIELFRELEGKVVEFSESNDSQGDNLGLVGRVGLDNIEMLDVVYHGYKFQGTTIYHRNGISKIKESDLSREEYYEEYVKRD